MCPGSLIDITTSRPPASLTPVLAASRLVVIPVTTDPVVSCPPVAIFPAVSPRDTSSFVPTAVFPLKSGRLKVVDPSPTP